MKSADFDANEQRFVRMALRLLRVRLQSWRNVGSVLGMNGKSVMRVAGGQMGVSAGLAVRVARYLDVPIDDMLVGKFVRAGVCPNCGYSADFNGDEKTVLDG